MRILPAPIDEFSEFERTEGSTSAPGGISSPEALGPMFGWWEAEGSDPGVTTGIVPQTNGTNNMSNWLDSSAAGANDLNTAWGTGTRQIDVATVGGFKTGSSQSTTHLGRGKYLGNTNDLKGNAAGSVFFYGRITSATPTVAQIFVGGQSDQSSRWFAFGVNGNEQLYVEMDKPYNEVGVRATWTNATTLTVNQMYCVVFAQDGTTGMKCYLDGVDKALTYDPDGSTNDPVAASTDWWPIAGLGQGSSSGITTIALGCRADGPTTLNIASTGIYGNILEAGIWVGTVIDQAGATNLTAYLQAKYSGA